MFCSKCGSPNPDNATFCVGCGSPLSAAQPAPKPAAQPSSKLKSSFFNAAPDLSAPVNAPQPQTPPAYSQPTSNPYTPPVPKAYNDAPSYAQPVANPYDAPSYAQPAANPYDAPSYAQPAAASYGYEQPAPKKKKLLPWLIGGGVAVVAIVVLIIVLVGGKGGASNPEDAALNFVKGIYTCDYDDVCDALYPDIADELDEDDFDELVSYLGSAKVSNYTVDDKERGDKSDRTKYEEFLEDYDIDVEIDDLYYVKVAFDVELLGYSSSASVKVIVAEIDGTWYVISSDVM